VAAVSDRALIMLAAADESFDHAGMSPQRIREGSRTGPFGLWRTIGIG
jgi:hypothetical protein